MLIGDIAERSGISRETIRYYEKRGLVEARARRDNNYREYSEEDLRRLRFIGTMKECGFTLREVGEFLDAIDDTGPKCGVTGPKLRAKHKELERKIAELERIRLRLKDWVSTCQGSGSESECTPVASALQV